MCFKITFMIITSIDEDAQKLEHSFTSGGAGQMLLAEDGLLVDLGLVDTAGLIGNGHMALQTGGGVLGAHAPVGDEQLGDLLVHGHQLDVSGSTLCGCQTPVVNGGNGTGTVDILKIQSILLDDGTLYGADVRTVLVVVNLKQFTCLISHE